MCTKKISYFVPKGYDYREVFVKCGNTNPFGGQALCNKCIDDPAIKQQQENADADNAWLRSAGWGEM
jgi:hypothetical protein